MANIIHPWEHARAYFCSRVNTVFHNKADFGVFAAILSSLSTVRSPLEPLTIFAAGSAHRHRTSFGAGSVPTPGKLESRDDSLQWGGCGEVDSAAMVAPECNSHHGMGDSMA